jgi:protein-S-isoprenylcysteine O-methyltransferase Ste14
MNSYQRIFGTGPRGMLASLVLLVLACYIEPVIGLPSIHGNAYFGYSIFALSVVLTVSLVVWSVKSLPPADRGRKLVTDGAFKYFRHPLYAAFLLFFNFGLAIFLDNWIYIIWAVVQHPLWHLNMESEEVLVRRVFGDEYDRYCAITGRFFPKNRSDEYHS